MNDLNALKNSRAVSTYREAYHYVEQASQSHRDHWDLVRVCQRHINGQKPIPDSVIKDKGLQWTWNFNFGKARAKIEKIHAENVAKMSTAIALSYVTFSYYNKPSGKIQEWLSDPQRASITSSFIALAFVETLRGETRLSDWLTQIEYPSISFGYTALINTEDDWIAEPVHPLSIAFRPNTRPDRIKEWVVFDKLTAKELYTKWESSRNMAMSYMENDEPVPTQGWSYQALESILLKLFRGKLNGNKRIENWADVIPNYTEKPVWFVQNTDDLEIAKIYITENDGTITETYIPWGEAWQSPDRKGAIQNVTSENAHESLILFQKRLNKSSPDIVTLIRDSAFSETGNIQDLRGIAKFAVEDSIRYNRLRNSLGNKTMLLGSPFFEKNTTAIGDKFKMTVSQGFVLLPTSHTLLPTQPSFNIAEQINMLRFEEGEYLRDTQQFDASIQGRLTSRPNRGEVQRITEEVETINASKNNIKLRDYSRALYNAIRNIASKTFDKHSPGKEGQDRFFSLIKKYLSVIVETDKDVKDLISCIDSYIIDPVITDEETIQLAIQMAETPFARNRFKRMLLAAKGLPIEEINIAVPLIIDKYSMMQDDRIAAIENDMFWTTNEVVIQGTDDHIIHFESHGMKARRVIEGTYEGKIDPIDSFKYLSNILPHLIQHLEMLGADPSLNFKVEEYSPFVKELIQERNKIQQAAEQMIRQKQEQEQQVQMDPETQSKIANDQAKVMADTQRKDWIAEQRTQQRNKQIDYNHEAKLREIELAAQVKSMKQ